MFSHCNVSLIPSLSQTHFRTHLSFVNTVVYPVYHFVLYIKCIYSKWNSCVINEELWKVGENVIYTFGTNHFKCNLCMWEVSELKTDPILEASLYECLGELF